MRVFYAETAERRGEERQCKRCHFSNGEKFRKISKKRMKDEFLNLSKRKQRCNISRGAEPVKNFLIQRGKILCQ